MKTINNIKTQITECCGCGACANICPVGAIKIIQDKEGFYKPEIDENICVSCGKCLEICTIENNTFENNSKNPELYAAIADDSIRMKSSSGGAFSLIANEILDNNGIICGAAFSEDWRVEHIIIIDNKKDLEKLRGSKYVQSYISETLFKQLKEYLDIGRLVLFTGVPCQVAGLKNYLNKDYPNLYTIDLICAYAPSPKVFDKYLQENFSKQSLKYIKFRSKENITWGCSILQLQLQDESIILDKNYMTPYLDRLFKGSHCENCKFKKFPRPGDFTIGDFWRIEKVAPDMNDNKGTSAIFLNSAKAAELFQKIKPQFRKLKEMPTSSAGWQIDVKNKIYKTPACINFYKNIDKKTYNRNVNEAAKESNVGIINWWFVNNRGAILTNYALNEMVKNLGYNALTINYISPFERKNFENSFAQKFADKYIKRTRWINNKNELETLNNEIGTFIAGSDQIFRYYPCKAHGMIFYMGWVNSNLNKLISYSASFAVNEFEATENQKNIVKHYLNRFDYHSVRELDGVDIMNSQFDINCEQVLDPVFCIDKQKYIDMAEKSTDKIKEDFIAYYIMQPTKEKTEAINHIKKELNISKAIYLNPPTSIENWLWYIKNAKFVVTDSFHGTCFSIIFNKQFAVLPHEHEYPSRFITIDRITGLSSRFFYKNKDIYKSKDLFKEIDYEKVNKKIEQEAKRSIDWLKNALDSTKTKKLSYEQEMYSALIDDYTNLIESKLNGIVRPQKRNNILQNIFSVTNTYSNTKKHKIITILGIKIKIRIGN